MGEARSPRPRVARAGRRGRPAGELRRRGGGVGLRRPVVWRAGRLTVFYQRQYIESARRFEDATRLTPEHVRALVRFDALADDPEMHLRVRIEPGDVRLVYNHAQLHDRTAVLAWPEPERRRHPLRLWLSMEGDRELPPCFEQRYGSIEVGNRGGIVTEETVLTAPLE